MFTEHEINGAPIFDALAAAPVAPYFPHSEAENVYERAARERREAREMREANKLPRNLLAALRAVLPFVKEIHDGAQIELHNGEKFDIEFSGAFVMLGKEMRSVAFENVSEMRGYLRALAAVANKTER